MTLVQTPAALDRNPQAISLVQRHVGGVDGTTQHRGEDNIRKDVLLLEQATAVFGFLDTLLGQRDVDPAGELIGFIPCALSMTEQY